MANVDTSIYHATTGLASDTAAAHAAEHPLKLYSGWFCPFVQRAWIVLQEKRIPYQYVEVNPYHKEPAFLALNPRGLVPTLCVPVATRGGDDGVDNDKAGGKDRKVKGEKKAKPLFESSVICEYLNEVYVATGNDATQFGPSLFPQDSYERARARIWVDFVGSRVVPAFYRFLQHLPEKPYSLDEARANLLQHLETLTREADPEGPFFLGGQMSMVDVSVAPWMMRLFLIDHYKSGGVGIPAGGGEDGIWDRWRRWEKAVEERSSVRETMSERDRYIEVYKRYAEDQTQSGVGRATRTGRELP